ncbi:MAG: LPS export ABC transporter ATP-binding protein [Candidatus Omnitrophica bacterium]|nr:LPS export ABC transporter ATP-binding protein [Candidatus Omnitrophota bacterium]
MNLIEVKELYKYYKGRCVVNGVSVHIKRGEIVGLLGPNGAGKTTSFYMIMGIIRPDKGNIYFQGEEVTNLPMFKRARLGIGYLSQEPSIFRKLSVEDNIRAVLETLNLSKRERTIRLKKLLNDLDIAYLAKNKAYTLSGGERRRLEITRALATNPSLILLDEPFSGVDPIAVLEVQQILMRLKKQGLSILLTDHNVRETLSVTDRSYLMAEGKILISGTSEVLATDEKAKEIYLGEKFTLA